jgi:hypothetical protein
MAADRGECKNEISKIKMTDEDEKRKPKTEAFCILLCHFSF